MIRKMLLIATILILIVSCVGCNTVEGIGEDISAVGDGIQDAAN